MNESLFRKVLDTVIRCNCDEAQLIAGAPPIVRIQDKLIRLESACITPQDLSNIAQSISPAASLAELVTKGSTEFIYFAGNDMQFQILINGSGDVIATPIKGRS